MEREGGERGRADREEKEGERERGRREKTLNKFLIGLRTLNFKEEHRLFILKDFKKFLGDGLSKTF